MLPSPVRLTVNVHRRAPAKRKRPLLDGSGPSLGGNAQVGSSRQASFLPVRPDRQQFALAVSAAFPAPAPRLISSPRLVLENSRSDGPLSSSRREAIRCMLVYQA